MTNAEVIMAAIHAYLLGLLLAALAEADVTSRVDNMNRSINKTVWGLGILLALSASFYYFPYYLIPRGTQCKEYNTIHLTELLGTSGQVTFLSVLIALAAYTSNVFKNLREAEKRAPHELEWKKISEDKQWLRAVDIGLVVTGGSMALRTGALAGGYWFTEWDRQILASTGAIIGYFAFLHFRQWRKDKFILSPVYKKRG